MRKVILSLAIILIVTAIGTGISNSNKNKKQNIKQIGLTDRQIEYIIKLDKEEDLITNPPLISKTEETIHKPVKQDVPLKYKTPLNKDVQEFVYLESQKRNVPYELALAVIKVESDFNIKAKNKNTNGTIDKGLFQINSSNEKWLKETLKIKDLLNPYDNIKAGVFMLSNVLHNNESQHQALMVYNMGSRTVRKLNNRGIYSSRYSRKVVDMKNKLKKDSEVLVSENN